MTPNPTTIDGGQLDAAEIFSHLPSGRCGQIDRQYIDEVLDAGFGNWESADMLGRFETAFANKFGVPFAISHNSAGVMLSKSFFVYSSSTFTSPPL